MKKLIQSILTLALTFTVNAGISTIPLPVRYVPGTGYIVEPASPTVAFPDTGFRVGSITPAVISGTIGSFAVDAAGTNQNILLNSSGTGDILLNGTDVTGRNVGIGVTPTARLHVLDTTPDSISVYVQNIATSGAGANYGVFSDVNGVGANQNVGGRFDASGATANYGVMIATPVAAAGNYSIYSSSTAKAHIQGTTLIGNSVDTGGKLQVYSDSVAQLALYNGVNSGLFTTGNTGTTVFDAAGTAQGFAIQDKVSIGANVVNADTVLLISSGSGITGTSQWGVYNAVNFSSAATTNGRGFQSALSTSAAAFTLTDMAAFYAATPTIGAASAVTNNKGLVIQNQGSAGITNAYGIDIEAQSGAATTNVGLRNLGTTILGSGGTAIASVISGTGSLDFADMAAGVEDTQTVTVTGVATTGTPSVSLGWSAAIEDGVVVKQAWVSGANTVSVRVRNTTAGNINPAAVTCRATVTTF